MSNGQMVAFVFEDKFPLRSIHENGEPWFVAKDVFGALGVKWRGVVSLQKIPESWWVVRNLRTTQINQHSESGETEKDVYWISEAAVYKIAFRSNKPAASRFTEWVAGTVLPSIRKTGRYEAPGAEKSQLDPKLAEMATKAALVREARENHGVGAGRRAMANLGLLEDLGLTRFVDEDEGGPKRAPSKRERAASGRPHFDNIGLDALARVFDAPVDREPVGRIVRRAFDEDLDAHNLLRKSGIRVEPDGALLIATGERLWVGRLFRKETPCCARRLVQIPSATKTAPKRFGDRTQYRCVRVPAGAVHDMLTTLSY